MAPELLSAPISEAMHPDPVTIEPDEELVAAAQVMLERAIRHLPVVNDRNELVGMLSERDLRARIGGGLGQWPHAESQLRDVVSNLMSPDPLTLRASQSLSKAMTVFEEERIGAIPIVDGSERLVGILSYIDLLEWIGHKTARERHPHHHKLRHVTPPISPEDIFENTRELTGMDASHLQANLGSAEPPEGQENELLTVEDLEDTSDGFDLRPDEISATP